MGITSSVAPSKFDTVDESVAALKVVKRTGEVIEFNKIKITTALKNAFLKDELGNLRLEANNESSKVQDLVKKLTTAICNDLTSFHKTGGVVHIEQIQKNVEHALMRHGEYDIARSYILYREKRAELRKQQQLKAEPTYLVTMPDGQQQPLDVEELNIVVKEACSNLEQVNHEPIITETLKNIFSGIAIKDVYQALIMSARTLVETEPNYTYVAARLLAHNIRNEVLDILELPQVSTQAQLGNVYGKALAAGIAIGIDYGLLDPQLQNFDLDTLGKAIKPERDFLFTYLGLQTLYDRYFLHKKQQRFELPQTFFMRIAMGLAVKEQDKTTAAIKFYNLLSSFNYMSSTPTLFNSGTTRPQLSSCYISTIPDDLEGIYEGIGNNALLQKFAGGVGNDWTRVRAMGAYIKGTNGKSQGVIPFLNVTDATTIAVNQGGKRKGAAVVVLEAWHADVEEFIELRKNTGDDRRRTHDTNTALWIPDLFVKRVIENKNWTLFSPDEVPDLHDLYGKEFEIAYEKYEKLAQEGKINIHKSIPAINLWRKALSMLFETGHPWLTFKDVCNLRSPQQHVGVVHSSNLCTEITLNTSDEEIAVCNLGSVNLAQHINNKTLDKEKLKETVTTAIRMLDNVLDINYYSLEKTRRSNMRHRPIGLGLMGFQDSLYKMDIAYASEAAVSFADLSMECISYYAIEASCNLAKERGAYPTFDGSLWSKGILPIDSIELLQKNRDLYLNQDRSKTLDWDSLRKRVMQSGMRNSNVMAIAPTATISNICGITQSIEPTYQNLYVKSNLSGEFTIVNQYLVRDLKKLNLWDEVMVNDLKYFNGSIKNIDRIPEELKAKYATAFEIEPQWLIEAASRRQKWIDQAQSLNIYVANVSGKKLDAIYRTAWLRGLKTTYYCRSLGATDAEKSTLNRSKLNAVQSSNICPIDDPTCESCQ